MKELYTRLNQSPFFLPVVAFIVTFVAGLLLMATGIITINNQESVTGTAQPSYVQFTNQYGQSEQLHVEIADTPQTWESGLMLRTTLAPDSGMLFIFDTVQPRVFWMKDTLIPLDIIFLDQNLKVVNLYKNTKPDQTSETYPSQQPIKYALETNAGWSTTVGLKVGDQINLK